MLAEKDKVFEEAAHTIYDMSQDEAIRMQIQAREDFYRDQRAYQQWVDEQMRVRNDYAWRGTSCTGLMKQRTEKSIFC